MIGFNKTITIYNQWYDRATKKTRWTKTVVHNASWAGEQRVTTGEGLTSNDGYSVRILRKSFTKGYFGRDHYALYLIHRKTVSGQ